MVAQFILFAYNCYVLIGKVSIATEISISKCER
jgi:hypothetical protein